MRGSARTGLLRSPHGPAVAGLRPGAGSYPALQDVVPAAPLASFFVPFRAFLWLFHDFCKRLSCQLSAGARTAVGMTALKRARLFLAQIDLVENAVRLKADS